MAGKTITQLPLATTPLAGTEVLPIVRSGVTYKTTVADVAKSPQDGATANAVVYYNGSKAPASTSAFTFDGTTVAVTNPMRTSAGTAAAPAITPSGDTNTGIFFPAADTIAFAEGGTESARFDSAGNLGLGVTPSAWSGYRAIDIASNAVIGGSSSVAMFNNSFWNGSSMIYKNTAAATYYQQTNSGQHQWFTAPSGTAGNAITFTQAMTLDASGNWMVGTTGLDSSNGTGVTLQRYSNGAYITIAHTTGAGSGEGFVAFYRGSSQIGGIAQNGTTAVSYNTTSDYRLKENVQPIIGALAKVAALKPCTYTWKSAPDEIGEGFIAHELAEVCPQAVTGEKDAVNEDGSIKPQSIDTSFLVATLTAAIQEQQAIIESLTARVAALEAK